MRNILDGNGVQTLAEESEKTAMAITWLNRSTQKLASLVPEGGRLCPRLQESFTQQYVPQE
jgi:hypothetical protein